MRDAVGGAVNLVIIVVFMVIVSGYMAFNISYMKAFKVKNKIISTFEEFDGNCDGQTTCNTVIQEAMRTVGYNVSSMDESDAESYSSGESTYMKRNKAKCQLNGAYCYVDFYESSCMPGTKKRYHYYKIYTRVTMDIPIVNKIMEGFRFFQVSGDTKRLLISDPSCP